MPSISKYRVKNYEFNVNIEQGDADGVIITPNEIELLGDPEYISELSLMAAGVAFIKAHDLIEREAADNNELPLIKISPDESLETLIGLREFARQNPYKELSDQAETYLREIAIELESRAKKRLLNSSKKGDQFGYVYLVQSPSGFYKIGRTSDPANRMKTFSVKLPFEVKYICLIETPNMSELEKLLHKAFSDKRGNGEWFKLDDEDVEMIKSLAVQP